MSKARGCKKDCCSARSEEKRGAPKSFSKVKSNYERRFHARARSELHGNIKVVSVEGS